MDLSNNSMLKKFSYNEKAVDVFWTGGWDSTYRVIQLLQQGWDVQPHYIKDPDRSSTERELLTMKELVDLFENNSKLKGSLLPLRVVAKFDIPEYKDVEVAYLSIINICYIGEQYKWISEYCRWAGIKKIEISVHSVQGNSFIEENYSNDSYPFSVLFERVSFPLLKYQKLDMREWCFYNGFLDIIEKTWFCHSPTKSGMPCGLCHPCITVMEEGLGYRLSLGAKVRYYLRIVPRVKTFLKKKPKLYSYIFRAKKRFFTK